MTALRKLPVSGKILLGYAGTHGAGMEQIAAAMTSINQATTGTAGGARQLQEAAGSLNDLAHRLASLVGDYRPNGQSLRVGG